MNAGFVEVEDGGDSLPFVGAVEKMLEAPTPPEITSVHRDEECEWSPRIGKCDEGLDELVMESQFTNDTSLRTVARRKINLLVGPRGVRREAARVSAQEEDNVDMNNVRVSEIRMSDEVEGVSEKDVGWSRSGRKTCPADIPEDDDFCGIVTGEIPVSSVRDDSALYVRKRMYGDDATELLFRNIEKRVMDSGTSPVRFHRDLLQNDGFKGLIQVDSKCASVEIPGMEMNVGIRGRNMGIVGDGVNSVFSINLGGTKGSGTRTQTTKMHGGHRGEVLEIRFDYHRIYNPIDGEELMNYFLSHKCTTLRDLFCGIASVSQPGLFRSNCLKFIEVKMSLLFGEASISPYDIGSSLLFFLRVFGRTKLPSLTNKLIEYIEYALGELCISPVVADELLFLHETCIFVNRLIWMEENLGDRARRCMGTDLVDTNKWYEVLYGLSMAEVLDIFTYHIVTETHGSVSASMKPLVLKRRTSVDASICVSDIHMSKARKHRVITSGSIGDYLLETLSNLRAEHMEHHSLTFRRIASLHRKVLEIKHKNIGSFVPQDKFQGLVNSILDRDRPFMDEVLSLCTLIKEISQIIPTKTPRLDKGLVGCIEKVMFMFTETLRDFLDDGMGNIEEIFSVLYRFYFRLHHLESNIHEELFKSDVHHIIEEEIVYRLRKIPGRTRQGLERLRPCRKVHNEHQKLLRVMEYDVESSYCLEERQVFMGFYDTRRIRKALQNPDTLEREVLKMINKGVTADDDVYTQYKLYLYECIKENARMYLGSEYNKVMVSVNKYFL